MNFKKHILIITLYSLITLGFTWPLILNLNKATPSLIPFYPQYKNMTDEYSEIWVTWQLKKAIEKKENFFFIKEIFYPLGANFVVADHSLAESLMIAPILFLFENPTIAYNSIVLLSFILTSYAGFLLIYYLTKNKESSFLGGLILSLSSVRVAHILAAHIGIFSLQWSILFILYFIKIFKEDRTSNYIMASIFFLLTTLTSYYLCVFLIIFMFFWLAFQIRIKNILKVIKLCLLLGLTHSPLLLLILEASNQGYFPQGKGVFEMSYFYGSDLLGFFVPAFFHTFFKSLVRGFYNNLAGNAWEHTTYIGYTVLFLSLFSIFKFRKNKEVKKFAFMGFVFFVFSLGAVLWIGGKPLMFGNKFIFMPQYLFKFIPILNNLRLPSRFFLMSTIFLTIISSYYLKFIFEKSRKKLLLLIILSSLILVENLSIPFPLNKNLEIPKVYESIAKEKEDITILEVPFCLASGVKALGSYWTKFQYYQTVHQLSLIHI